MAAVNVQIEKNFKETRLERDERVASERKILDDLKTDAKKIEDAIVQEQTERLEMQNELMNKLQTELARQRKKAERVMKDTQDEFTKDRADN